MNDWIAKNYVAILNRLRTVEYTLHTIAGLIGFFFLLLPSMSPGLRVYFYDVELLHRLFHDFTSFGPIFRQCFLVFSLSMMPWSLFMNRYLRELDAKKYYKYFVSEWPSVVTMHKLPAPRGLFQVTYFLYWCVFGVLFSSVFIFIFGAFSVLLRQGEFK